MPVILLIQTKAELLLSEVESMNVLAAYFQTAESHTRYWPVIARVGELQSLLSRK